MLVFSITLMPELICENWTFFDMTPNGVTGNERVRNASCVAYLL